MTEPIKPRLIVLTPWFPTDRQPHAGIFIRDWIQARAYPPADTLIIHLEHVYDVQDAQPATTDTGLGTVLRLPIVAAVNTPRARVAELARETLTAHASQLFADAEEIHAHVGLPSAYAVAQLAAPNARVLLIEHASYLRSLLIRDETFGQYQRAISRADLVLAVGHKTAEYLLKFFPRHREKMMVSGNPVDFSSIALRDHVSSSGLHNWLSVGNLIPLKRVSFAISAFARWRSQYPQARYTIVGSGVQRDALEAQVRELGLAQSVQFEDHVFKAELNELFLAHDVFVHLSEFETFGLAPLEAVASGMPAVVTNCGGPQYTLSAAQSDGLVSFIPIQDDPDLVVTALQNLTDSAPHANLQQTRRILELRYGRTNFFARIDSVLAGMRSSQTAVSGSYLAVIFSEVARKRVAPVLELLAAHERPVIVIHTMGARITGLDPRFIEVDLEPYLRRLPWRFLTHYLVKKPPVLLASLARHLMAPFVRLPQPIRKVALTGRGFCLRFSLAWEPLVERIYNKVGGNLLAIAVEPAYLARSFKRHFPELLNLDGLQAITSDDRAIPLIWELLHANSTNVLRLDNRPEAFITELTDAKE